MKFGDAVRARIRHACHIDRLYRVTCDCGWRGPVREWDSDADADRTEHWRGMR